MMGINRRKRLYEGKAMSRAIYGDETWSMAIAENRLNVMEMRCLRSRCGVALMD